MNTTYLRLLPAAILALGLTACAPPSGNDAQPVVTATAEPTPAPTPEPTPEPTPVPTAKPTAKPAPKPAAPKPVAQPQAAAPAPVCANCGTVAAITPVQVKGEGSGAGALIGAAAGGVAGHQIGGGKGKDIATVAGAILGAAAGHQAEKQVRAVTVYDVTVRMDNGTQRSIQVPDASSLSVGTAVQVEGNNIYLR